MNEHNHQRQKFTQILFPFVLAILLTVAAAFFLFRGFSSGSLEHHVWANISAVLVIFPVLICVGIAFLFLIALNLLTGKLRGTLALKMSQLNSPVTKFSQVISKAAKNLVQPAVMLESALGILTVRKTENDKQETHGKQKIGL